MVMHILCEACKSWTKRQCRLKALKIFNSWNFVAQILFENHFWHFLTIKNHFYSRKSPKRKLFSRKKPITDPGPQNFSYYIYFICPCSCSRAPRYCTYFEHKSCWLSYFRGKVEIRQFMKNISKPENWTYESSRISHRRTSSTKSPFPIWWRVK